MSKQKNKPIVGQVYTAEFSNNYWFAIVILQVDGNSNLVYTTAYYEKVPPTLDSPDLHQYYYGYDYYREKKVPSIYWIDGKPGDNFKLIGELDLGNKKAIEESEFYSGIWKEFLPMDLLVEKEAADVTVFEEKLPSSQASKFEKMEDVTYWSLIDLIDLDKEYPMESLICNLEKMPVEMIYSFEETLSYKLFILDRPEHAGVKSWLEEYLSPDAFLYARCAVIAKGKHFFDQVVKESAQIDLALDAEELLEVAGEAYSRKTGEPFDYVSNFDYETYSNESAWGKRYKQK